MYSKRNPEVINSDFLRAMRDLSIVEIAGNDCKNTLHTLLVIHTNIMKRQSL